MDIYIMQSPLMSSPEEAVVSANSVAMSNCRPLAKKVHIHVIAVIQVDDLWKAIVQVVIEPELEAPEEDPREKKEAEKEKPKPKSSKEQNEAENKESGSKHEENPELKREYKVEYKHEVHFYMHPREADRDNWDTVLPKAYPDYSFHFYEQDQLWNVSRKIFPDIDFDMAASPKAWEYLLQSGGEDAFSVEPKLEKNPFILELTEDL